MPQIVPYQIARLKKNLLSAIPCVSCKILVRERELRRYCHLVSALARDMAQLRNFGIIANSCRPHFSKFLSCSVLHHSQ
jgi:hypothetical protein